MKHTSPNQCTIFQHNYPFNISKYTEHCPCAVGSFLIWSFPAHLLWALHLKTMTSRRIQTVLQERSIVHCSLDLHDLEVAVNFLNTLLYTSWRFSPGTCVILYIEMLVFGMLCWWFEMGISGTRRTISQHTSKEPLVMWGFGSNKA